MGPEPSEAIACLWQQLRRLPSRADLWLDLAHAYVRLGLLWQAGYAARQSHRLDPSLRPQLDALALGSWQDTTDADALLASVGPSEAAQLTRHFNESVAHCPGDWLTWLYLARLYERAGASGQPNPALGQHALEQAQTLEPIIGESLHWMGVWRLNAHDAQGAVAAFSGLLNVRPVRFGSMMYLGEALLRVGNVAAAEKAFARASGSNNPDFLQNLAARVFAQNYWQEAIEILKKALSLRADSVPLLLALASLQSQVYALADCEDSLRQIQALAPEHPEARLIAAGLKGRLGDARSHLAALQAALEAGADPLSRLASSVAMTALYHDTLPSSEVADLHRSLCEPIEASVPQTRVFSNERNPDKRLHIAYLSGDIHRQHPVNIFILPVLLRHDRTQFEVSVYHTGTMHDNYTRQAQACVDHWHETAGWDDPTLHRAIVAHGVDVLVDLAGHTASHRLGVLALRAAPVQASFLGYPHSTGMSRIDWLIGDATVSPASQAHLFSEGIAQMPNSVFCWSPVDTYPLPPPRPVDATLVFGSFNNAMKLSPKTIALWSRVLQALPQSQLMLKAPSLREQSVQARFIEMFAQQGVARERLILRGPSGLAEMMEEYGDIDIALDPTPYNGGTTTLQALWMGVPVLSLAGDNFVSRMGASFMKTLGQPDWVAEDGDAYLLAAQSLAAQLPSLRMGRADLRKQVAQSALGDIDHYVLGFQALLRRMWRHHCQGLDERLLPAQPTPPPHRRQARDLKPTSGR